MISYVFNKQNTKLSSVNVTLFVDSIRRVNIQQDL